MLKEFHEWSQGVAVFGDAANDAELFGMQENADGWGQCVGRATICLTTISMAMGSIRRLI